MASIALSSAKSEMEPAVLTHLHGNRPLPAECAPVMPGMQMHSFSHAAARVELRLPATIPE